MFSAMAAMGLGLRGRDELRLGLQVPFRHCRYRCPTSPLPIPCPMTIHMLKARKPENVGSQVAVRLWVAGFSRGRTIPSAP